MKSSVIAFLIFICMGFKCSADCAGTGLYVFPNQKEIKKTSVFILDGYAESQHVINGLNKQFPIYLKSGGERISLVVEEIHVGQFFLTQALLKPERSLTPGKEYQLVIEHLPDYENLGNYNSKTQKYDAITYFVTDESDTEVPRWIVVPKEKNKSFRHYGCGPSIHVNFDSQIKEQSDYLIKTTVRSVETGKETTYYISEGREGISIGHGMCSGAFIFDEGMNYQVKFMIIDVSGNVSEETEWIAFTKPEKAE
ncbi:MAG: hypothetical protein K0S23_230 [Fluviicola sp.]|jgi:hypothetical protein|uniref:hypothetical protein n=1 Tax=Fluviicola sp. TaxID=1917219 RepID=UPI00260D9B59|nr:hypothetical protein [Fluviicola sp.]MDF3025923.1 hypothetical protein [Fluviicola sp.]